MLWPKSNLWPDETRASLQSLQSLNKTSLCKKAQLKVQRIKTGAGKSKKERDKPKLIHGETQLMTLGTKEKFPR